MSMTKVLTISPCDSYLVILLACILRNWSQYPVSCGLQYLLCFVWWRVLLAFLSNILPLATDKDVDFLFWLLCWRIFLLFHHLALPKLQLASLGQGQYTVSVSLAPTPFFPCIPIFNLKNCSAWSKLKLRLRTKLNSLSKTTHHHQRKLL